MSEQCVFCDAKLPNVTFQPFDDKCSNCWEVHHRIARMPIKVLNRIVKSARRPPHYVPKDQR